MGGKRVNTLFRGRLTVTTPLSQLYPAHTSRKMAAYTYKSRTTISLTIIRRQAAFLAAHAKTRELMELFQSARRPALPSDPLVLASTPLVPECVNFVVMRRSHPDPASLSPRPHKLYREFSVAIDDALDKLRLDIGDSICI